MTSPLCVIFVLIAGETPPSVEEDALLLVEGIVKLLEFIWQRQEEVDLGLRDSERSESRQVVA